jgi:hypothetical protein
MLQQRKPSRTPSTVGEKVKRTRAPARPATKDAKVGVTKRKWSTMFQNTWLNLKRSRTPIKCVFSCWIIRNGVIASLTVALKSAPQVANYLRAGTIAKMLYTIRGNELFNSVVNCSSCTVNISLKIVRRLRIPRRICRIRRIPVLVCENFQPCVFQVGGVGGAYIPDIKKLDTLVQHPA